MATPNDPSAAASTSSTTPSKPLNAISILDTPLAKTYNQLHPVLVLGIFLASFRSLVADPLSTMLGVLAPLAALQAVYAVLCLPGTQASPSSKSSGGKKAPAQSQGLGAKIVPALISTTLSLSLGAPLLAAVLILFGAPFTTLQLPTLAAAAHIALLAGVPLVYVHGVDTARWRRVAALDVPIDDTFGAALGVLLGAWVGAVPIPLDWDREWQRWPVTVLAGAYGGWALGKAVGGTVGRGKRVRLD
ncbi:hypothetical protein K461DRAFT_100052 [Myriangium duriaei CBS 260.36]|uniref:Uncharacterized protein n=1 Tax=Myriangium duriaei CBS 260.36 TaxID=1168546 RepID=A0A9P4MIV0_9PEZI|nr:hypothetical protein K461DRAFT_100052 [Myriangium duriaei CBS 260.36]